MATTLLRSCFGWLIVGDLAADDLAVERQGLQHDVEALAVFVRKREADVEPVVVLAFPPDDCVDAMSRW